MPVDFEIDHGRKRVVARARGPVTLADLLAYFDAVMVENAGAYPKLFDARQANVQLSDDDMMVLAARASLYARFRPGPAAVVVDMTSEAAPLVQRYYNLAKRGREVELFESLELAEEWLRRAGP